MEKVEVDIGDTALGHVQALNKHKLFNALDTFSKGERERFKGGWRKYC